jgi:hypothetical protein
MGGYLEVCGILKSDEIACQFCTERICAFKEENLLLNFVEKNLLQEQG